MLNKHACIGIGLVITLRFSVLTSAFYLDLRMRFQNLEPDYKKLRALAQMFREYFFFKMENVQMMILGYSTTTAFLVRMHAQKCFNDDLVYLFLCEAIKTLFRTNDCRREDSRLPKP